MARLADGEILAHIGGGHETQRPDECGSAVGQNVTVQVGGDDDVVVLGLAEELVHHAVNDLLLDIDELVFLLCERAAGGAAEKAVGLAEDVALVRDISSVASVTIPSVPW